MDINDLSTEVFLDIKDVDARITELESGHAGDGDYTADLGTEVQELSDLRDFRAKVGQVSTQLISENGWDEFAADMAGEIYGRPATESIYWDDDLWAGDLKTDYHEASLNGTTFYYKGY